MKPSFAIHARRGRLLRALVLLCSSSAFAAGDIDYPERKPGLWEMSVQADGASSQRAGGMVTQQCIDAATDKAMRKMGMGTGEANCSAQDMRRDGGRLVIDSVCKIGASTVTTHSVMSGDFGSSYRMESRSTYRPALAGRTEGTSVIESRWIGPCKAGQKPGDVMMPNGMTMNMLDIMGGRKK